MNRQLPGKFLSSISLQNKKAQTQRIVDKLFDEKQIGWWARDFLRGKLTYRQISTKLKRIHALGFIECHVQLLIAETRVPRVGTWGRECFLVIDADPACQLALHTRTDASYCIIFFRSIWPSKMASMKKMNTNNTENEKIAREQNGKAFFVRNLRKTGHGGIHLQSQHVGGRDR